jgi:GNAT superfamily N-acetyltransferase
MVWRGTADERTDRASRKSALTKRIRKGVPVGILGYQDNKPIALCSIAPRESYRDLGGAPEKPGEDIWSLVFFFGARGHRGKGTIRRLITAGIEHARRRGATIIEAYPVDPDSPSYKFMGFVNVFEEAGFHEVGRTGTRWRGVCMRYG